MMLPKRRPQPLFHSLRRLLFPETSRERSQSFRQPPLRLQRFTALRAFPQMRRRFPIRLLRVLAGPRPIRNQPLHFLAIHTRAFFPAFHFSSNIPRARCSRDRTVPTAQPIAAAASA